LPEHPLVTRLKQDTTQPAQRSIALVGLAGDSDREGVQRLYLNQQLDYYAEFNIDDMLQTELVPAGQSPFQDIEATRVSIAPDAIIHYTRVRSFQAVDQFDLEPRFGVPLEEIARRWTPHCDQLDIVWIPVPRNQ
jgi:hypothetical protein